MKKGDVCTLPNRPGFWVFAGDSPAAVPPLTMGRFLRATDFSARNPHEAITIGMESATLVTSPVFTPGETVTHERGTATVESDGVDTVTLTYSRHVPVPPRGHAGENFAHTGRAFADRARLVIDNIDKFIIA
jgi:hypothetical protein